MNINVLLISPSEVRSMTTMSNNLDDCYVITAIVDAQLTGLQPIIGTPLYDKLCTLVADDALGDSGLYNELVETYIKQYLVQQVQVELLVQSIARTHNAGTVQYVDASYQTASLQDVKYLRDYYANKASFFGERIIDFLTKHCNEITEYRERTFEMGSCDKADTYRCGIKL